MITQDAVKHNGFALPTIVEKTIGRQGKAGKEYYKPDYNELMVTRWVLNGEEVAENTPGATKEVSVADSAAQLGCWFGDWDTLVWYAGGQLDKCLYSLQCSTPESRKDKDGKPLPPLTDSEKYKLYVEYIGRMHEDAKRSTGARSEYNAAQKAMEVYMRSIATKQAVLDMDKLNGYLAAINTAQAKLDAQA